MISMKIKKPYYILGGILCLLAAVFVVIAMMHPEPSFPWANWVSYTIYVLYAIYTILVFLMPHFKGVSFATCGIVGIQLIALALIVLSIGRRFEVNESNWYLPIGLGLTCVANFTVLSLQKRRDKTK